MSYFINYRDGKVSIDTSRAVDAAATDMNDIIDAMDEKREEVLTASLDIFIEEEANKIMDVAETCKNQDELDDFIMGEGDFLEPLLERSFGIQLADYPDLRDLQRQKFEHIEFTDE